MNDTQITGKGQGKVSGGSERCAVGSERCAIEGNPQVTQISQINEKGRRDLVVAVSLCLSPP